MDTKIASKKIKEKYSSFLLRKMKGSNECTLSERNKKNVFYHKIHCFTHHQTRPSLQRIVTRLQLIWSKINVCSNNLSRDYWSSLELVSEWSPGTGAWYEYLNRPIIGPGLSSLRIPGQHLQCHSTDFVWFNTLDYISKAEHFVCPGYVDTTHSTFAADSHPSSIPHFLKYARNITKNATFFLISLCTLSSISHSTKR